MQNHPIRILETFLDKEKATEQAKRYDDMRFIGYILDLYFPSFSLQPPTL